MTRNGKIARLPKAIREELNRRLENGGLGVRLVEWLNALPEVKAVLAGEFNGRAISEQNLSEWKAGGYCDWEKHQERRALVRQLAEDAEELEASNKTGEFNRHLSVVLAAELAQATREALAQKTDAKERLACVEQAVGKLAQLRREESSGERVRLIRERWQAEQNQAEAKGNAAHALFPVQAAMLHQAFVGMLAASSPEIQMGTTRVLETLMEKRKKHQSAAIPPAEKAGSTRFEPVQGKSSNAGAAYQTKSDPIQPKTNLSNGHAPVATPHDTHP